MPGRFKTSPNHIIGLPYAKIADYPDDRPIAQSPDGKQQVYKGIRKVYLVTNGIVTDFFDWEILGNQYRHIQKQAQRAWGMTWLI